jgi:hypothetical protein
LRTFDIIRIDLRELVEQFKEQAELISSCFGDKVTRCIFSNAWAPRVEGLSYLQKLLESKKYKQLSDCVINSLEKVLQLALNDRVNAVVCSFDASIHKFFKNG